jgi:S1-C subfamily serine protease
LITLVATNGAKDTKQPVRVYQESESSRSVAAASTSQDDSLRQSESMPESKETILHRKVAPAVVKILTLDGRGSGIGSGSGFLVSDDGRIVTNHHVISGARAMFVEFDDGTRLPVVRVAAVDRDSDIAIVIVDCRDRPFLTLANDGLPPVGTHVYAFGNPLGLTKTITQGLVTGHDNKTESSVRILTDAAISSGSSGGPLVLEDGRVVGVTTASFVRGQNLNIVVPARLIGRLLDSL